MQSHCVKTGAGVKEAAAKGAGVVGFSAARNHAEKLQCLCIFQQKCQIMEMNRHSPHCTKNVAVPLRFEQKARLIKICSPIGKTTKQVLHTRVSHPSVKKVNFK